MKKIDFSSEEIISDIFSRRYSNYYSWGIEEVDRKGGLLTLGRMAIIGGGHAAGKSTYISEIARINSRKKKTMMIPLEMGVDFTVMTLGINLFNKYRGENMEHLGYGEVEEGYLYLRPQEDQDLLKQCLSKIYEDYPNLYIKTPNSLIFDNLKQLIIEGYKDGINFFIIDHLHQLSCVELVPNSEGEMVEKIMEETPFFSKVSKELASLAKELNIAILAVVQLTKKANEKNAEIDLSAFKGTSEFSSNSHRVVIIKKPYYKELTKSEAKELNKINQIGCSPAEILKTISDHQLQFEEETKNVRELIFLKTRGRDGGTITVEFHEGEFMFQNYGKYIY